VNGIVAEVARRGRVSFRTFMELALYHPRCGYYTRPRRGPGPVGPEGDFITAPTASPLFVATLARLFDTLAERLECGLTLLELGAGEGVFLESLTRAVRPTTLARVVAVEIAPWARQRALRCCRNAEVVGGLEEVERPTGSVVLFASELYDALPVHRVTMARVGGQLVLQEYFVEVASDGRLVWVCDTPESGEVATYLHESGIVLEEGQVAEVRPELRKIHARNLAWCGRDALALVVEYGHPARRLFDARSRRHGSLVAYTGHRLVRDVLSEPGRLDITAHVNFDDLEGAAADVGWDRGELRPLGLFLALHGAVSLLPSRKNGPLTPAEWAALAAAKKLLVPAGMASDLKVLAQGKGRVWRHYLAAATPPPMEA
jgi:SAM-dependent MidA family methyltransferase